MFFFVLTKTGNRVKGSGSARPYLLASCIMHRASFPYFVLFVVTTIGDRG
jgi:hypothetical protein